MRLIDRFLGYCRVDFEKKDKEAVHNLLYRLHVDYWSYTEEEEGCFLMIRARQREYVRAFAEKEKVALQIGRIEGAPRLVLRYSGRYGVFFGTLAAIALVVLSGLFTWDVRIEGNEKISDAEVRAELAEQGLTIGSFLPALDLEHITNMVLIESDDVGWISLYRKGNVVYAKVLEKENADKDGLLPSNVGKGANLVAAEDAVILSYALVRGRPTVRQGQVVKKGDLIATGVLEGRDGTSFVTAEGEVYGRVLKDIRIEIPFEQTVETVKSTVLSRKEINFFGKKIKISNNSGNLPSKYDTIENKEQIYLFGRIGLPLFIEKTYAVTYQEEKVTLNESEAVRLAYRRLNTEVTRYLAGGELLSRETEAGFTDNSYVLTCRIAVSQNIAKAVPFVVENKK